MLSSEDYVLLAVFEREINYLKFGKDRNPDSKLDVIIEYLTNRVKEVKGAWYVNASTGAHVQYNQVLQQTPTQEC